MPSPLPQSLCRLRCWLGAAIMLSACLCAAINFNAGNLLRNGKLSIDNGDRRQAELLLRRSIRRKATAPALYTLAGVKLFGQKAPAEAIRLLSRIEDELGMPAYIHSCGYLARAYAAVGNYDRALEYFKRESDNFPFSIINTALQLSILEKIGAPTAEREALSATLNRLFGMRGINAKDFHKFLRNPALDDAPMPLIDLGVEEPK